MKILTAAEMGATDKRTSESFGISLGALMERAGAAVAEFCVQQYPEAHHIGVICGKGNNGGDGLVAARVLASRGRLIRVALLGSASELKGEARAAFERLKAEATEVKLHEIHESRSLKEADLFGQDFNRIDFLIDAVVGTGFRPPLRAPAAAVRDWINSISIPVVAVDLPSGWDAEKTEGAFKANAVVTFTAPKRAHIFGHLTVETLGPVVVAPIGSPEEAIGSSQGLTWAGDSKKISERPRAVNSNKGKFGHVMVIGGSYGTAGAPSMSSLAALRAGAGLVTAAVPERIAAIVGGFAPELMVKPLKEGPEGSIALSAATSELLEKMTVVALGPGLSQKGDAKEFARSIVAKTTVPMVLDADGLNAFANQADLLDGRGRVLVLTPHPGEMARLVGMTVKEVEADRVDLARRFATEHHLTLVLKGWRTLIAHPDGRVAVNTSGNPAMAKGGSGDILTGILAAMLAQYPDDPAAAVEAGVYLHGLAADFAAQAMDEHTVLATDTLAHLTDAFRYRVTDESGFTWICGLRR
jgi:NAD(P)H-hydrate epimerase